MIRCFSCIDGKTLTHYDEYSESMFSSIHSLWIIVTLVYVHLITIILLYKNIIGRLFLLLINAALEKLTMHACFQVFQTNIGRNNSIPKMKPLSFTREMREQNQRMYKKRKKEIQRNIDWS